MLRNNPSTKKYNGWAGICPFARHKNFLFPGERDLFLRGHRIRNGENVMNTRLDEIAPGATCIAKYDLQFNR
jgi:hypothetical protein